ncbi:hypothetical protein Pcinc_000490 [Petrolisthes cinctipes]|uniref:Uncharacterized protein n=1 Tax=Petrolisthes cinctipes TaxID=88211 RepID=A0AAE1L4E4_PETCI|nr:hypothetical protein Pcinc_000490 [Petrolisthes cinctipes]
MTSTKDLLELGNELGFEGESLFAFIKDEQTRERELRQEEREKRQEESWGVILSSYLGGSALETYARLSEEDIVQFLDRSSTTRGHHVGKLERERKGGKAGVWRKS